MSELARPLAPDLEERAGAAGWAALTGGACDAATVESADVEAWAGRMADLISPALADHLLGGALIQPERAAKARLYSRFLWRRQVDAVRLLRGAGLGFVCLKGFALAHQVYRRPEPRIVGDVDLLLLRQDLQAAAAVHSAAGFAAMPIAIRFGFISDSSFLPIVSADGQVAIDLHIAPDAWPTSRGLSAEEVFARATPFRAADLDLLGPAPEHAAFLLATNIAKDRFGPEGVRKVLDAAMLLRAHPRLDWPSVGELARASGHVRALGSFLALLEGLGVRTDAPAWLLGRSRGAWASGELRRVLAGYRRARVPRLGFYDKLRREFLLGADPILALRVNLKRLRGLARPGTGLPPGMPERR